MQKTLLILIPAIACLYMAQAQMSPQLRQLAERSGLPKWDVLIDLKGQTIDDAAHEENGPVYHEKDHHNRHREWSCHFAGVTYGAPPTPNQPHQGDIHTQFSFDKESWESATGHLHYSFGLEAGDQRDDGSSHSSDKIKATASKDTFSYDVRINLTYTNDHSWSVTAGFNPGDMTENEQKEWTNTNNTPSRGSSNNNILLNDGFSWDASSAGKDPNPIRLIPMGNSYEIDIPVHRQRKIGSVEMNAEGMISIRPHIDRDYLAYIEPVGGMEAYKKWLPEGNIKDSLRKPGNNQRFFVYVVKRSDTTKRLDMISRISYELKDVSHVPGACMNYPSRNIDVKADLSLDNALRGMNTGNPYDQEIMQLKIYGDAAAQVNSFDFGAYGKISATLVLTNGLQLTAHCREDDKEYMSIPYRTDENSNISDYWKQQNKAVGMKDDEDRDKMGTGVGEDFPGDGYSVYEEYRGFRENKKHIRTDPGQADLLILNKVTNEMRARDGINLYQGVTGIVPHSRFRDDEFGEDKEEPGLNDSLDEFHAGFHYDHNKVMNFNYEEHTHLVDQHGLMMVSSPDRKGFAQAVAKGKFIGTPKNYCFLVITADFKADSSGYASTRGDIRGDTAVTQNSNGKAEIITDEYAVTVAHEMLHYSNVMHHGDLDMDEISIFPDPDHPNADHCRMRTKDGNHYNVNLRLDDVPGTPITSHDTIFWKTHNHILFLNVSVQHGTHSGNEDCIMRYDISKAYFDESMDNLYLVGDPARTSYANYNGLNMYREMTGISLCDSGKGTGVNAKDHVPRPRYGDAVTHGCKQQVAINDKYAK